VRRTPNAATGLACSVNIILYKLPLLDHSNEFVWLDFSHEYAKTEMLISVSTMHCSRTETYGAGSAVLH